MKHIDVIGEGSTAQVVALSPKKVAKLFYEDVSDDSIEQEFVVGKLISDSGLPAPAVCNSGRIADKRAIIYERIEGTTVTRLFENKPWLALRLLKQMAHLQVNIHDKNFSLLPSQRDVLLRKINSVDELDDKVKTTLYDNLGRLPDGESLCHGDFHPDNILLSGNNPIIIDWADASKGNREADLARTLLILRFGGLSTYTSSLKYRTMLFVRKLLANYYRHRYNRHYSFSKSSLRKWMVIVAGARLSEKLPHHEKKQLVSLIETYVKGERF